MSGAEMVTVRVRVNGGGARGVGGAANAAGGFFAGKLEPDGNAHRL